MTADILAGPPGAPPPEDRLGTLRATGLLDSPPGERFDRLTRLAAAALQVPVSLISLVDADRQFFKSTTGLAEPWASRRETPLTHSFCQHVVGSRAPLAVTDARQHPLVRDNQAIDDLGVIAYLGVPFFHVNGCALGALCAIDTVPRTWSDQDLRVLTDFAALVQSEIEQERMNALLRAQIAEQARLAEELGRARDAAEAGQRSKADFLAMISHELRTPLNGVIGLAGLLLDGSMDAQSRLHTKMLREAGEHLLEMINDLLDFSKLEVDRLEFEDVAFNFPAMVQSVLDLTAPKAHEKGLEIGAFVAPDVPRLLMGDPARLRQVLLNLISNAIKFTSSGSAMLEVAARDVTAGQARIGFSVTDTGMGIPANDIPHLFAKFTQLDRSISRRFGGTGLGLAICQRLVRRMGGEIRVASELGRGSTFSFDVVLPVAPPASSEPANGADLRGERVMLVHRDSAGGHLLRRQIESRGGIVAHIAEPDRALAQLLAGETAPPRAILVDHAFPGDAAGRFARRVRAQPKLSGVRLVLVSASDYGPDSRLGAHVFDARLLKPVPVDTLIYRLLGPEAAGMSPPPDEISEIPPAPRNAQHRILVAEDNKTNQAVIRAMLAKLGYRADIVGNGLEALAAVRDRPYDLVLMDVMMPEMDGPAATQRIRALPPPSGNIHIIALTADVSIENHARYRSAGMNTVLVKPLTLQSLASALSTTLL